MSKIAVLSDSHDNIPHLITALEQVRQSGADLLLHCGDLCSPFMMKHLGDGFTGGDIHIVMGNNDGDGRMLEHIASGFDHVHLNGVYHEGDHHGRKFGMIHYPEPARRIAQSGQFDLVCYGHNHLKAIEEIGGAFLVNPGEVFGLHEGAPSWVLYDCESHRCELKLIGG
jgi:hypothetical protein